MVVLAEVFLSNLNISSFMALLMPMVEWEARVEEVEEVEVVSCFS